MFVGGYTVFTLTESLSNRPCFRNVLFPSYFEESLAEFHQICKHIHMYKANTTDEKLRARGQYYWSYFPLKFLMAFVLDSFLNILQSYQWNFIKPWKHIPIFKTHTYDKNLRARGQYYWSYFPL